MTILSQNPVAKLNYLLKLVLYDATTGLCIVSLNCCLSLAAWQHYESRLKKAQLLPR